MRTKALLLGARARPIQGAWVPIDEADRWSCRVVGFPFMGNFEDAIDLKVRQPSGEVIVLPAFEEISGVSAKVVVKEEIEDVHLISVFVDSQ